MNLQEDTPLLSSKRQQRDVHRRWAKWLSEIMGLMFLGFGMFLESYVIFSTGQIKSIWKAEFPECWASHPAKTPTCPNLIKCMDFYPGNYTGQHNPVNSTSCQPPDWTYPSNQLCDVNVAELISYSEFAGIMGGMLVLAALVDRTDRRIGGISTMVIMLFGTIGMTVMPISFNVQLGFTLFAVCYFILGFGVGGEYTVCASSSTESPAQKDTTKRGRNISLSFSMQGLGGLVGSAMITLLLICFGQTKSECSNPNVGPSGYVASDLSWVWRIVYGAAAILQICYMIARIRKSSNESGFAAAKHQMENYSLWEKYMFSFKNYGSRLAACSICWFLWDVCFYGNKLFSAPIFASLVPDGSLLDINLFIMGNNACSLLGYYVAAVLIDKPLIGRRWLQTTGFGIITILFAICFFFYEVLPSWALIVFYFASSFFGQLVNVTTFVAPAEMFPSARRATMHGLCAFSGKAGALIATIVFGYLSTKEIFGVCALVSVLGIIPTVVFLPDLTGLNLQEIERQFNFFLAANGDGYHGEAINSQHCSIWENCRGYSRGYHGDTSDTDIGGEVDPEREVMVNQITLSSLVLPTVVE